jgi:hypothetical protein
VSERILVDKWPDKCEDSKRPALRLVENCQGKAKKGGKNGSSPHRAEDDLAELIADRLLFAFRHCKTLPDDGPSDYKDIAQDVSKLDCVKHVSGAWRERENRRDLKLYRRFVKLVLHDPSWFGIAWKARLAVRPGYRNPDALMYDAFMWFYEVPLLDADVREWLRAGEFNHIDHAATPEIWDAFRAYCAKVADHLRLKGHAPIRELPFAIAPVVSAETISGAEPIAKALGRSVRGTLRLIQGGKVPAVETDEGPVAMARALAPYRRHSKLAA